MSSFATRSSGCCGRWAWMPSYLRPFPTGGIGLKLEQIEYVVSAQFVTHRGHLRPALRLAHERRHQRSGTDERYALQNASTTNDRQLTFGPRCHESSLHR